MPFYFGQDRPCRRYDDQRCKADEASWKSTIEGTLRSLLDEKTYNANLAEGKEACQYIFIKVSTIAYTREKSDVTHKIDV